MEFEYFFQQTATGLLEIDDIGNCAIDLFNDRGEEKVLIIDTQLGMTRVLINGPFMPDMETLPKDVSCTYKQFPYSQGTINKIIRQCLNDYIFNTTQAIEIDKEEALNKCVDLIAYMRNNV